MTKTAKELFELYVATSTKKDDEFLSPQHTVQKHADRNGNGDDVFKGTNVKVVKRAPDHGYDAGEDVKAHIKKNTVPDETGHVKEEVEQIDEISSHSKSQGYRVSRYGHSYIDYDGQNADGPAKYVAPVKGDPDTIKALGDDPATKLLTKDDEKHLTDPRKANRIINQHKKGKVADVRESSEIVEAVYNKYIESRTTSVPKLDVLSENLSVIPTKTAQVILDLFESLTAENKETVLALSKTKEGINELVDFAINNGEI